MEEKKSERYKDIAGQINEKLQNLKKKENNFYEINTFIWVKQEEFNTVGNPKLFEKSDIIQKFLKIPNFHLPTERGLEEENDFPKRAIYNEKVR